MFNKGRENSSSDNDQYYMEDIELKRKVRRRVKKGTKDEVLSKIKRENAKKNIFIADDDTSDMRFLGDNHKINRVYEEKPKREKKAPEWDSLDVYELDEQEQIQTLDEEELKKEKKKKRHSKNIEYDKLEEDFSRFRENSMDWQDDEYKTYKETVRDGDSSQRSLGVSTIAIVASLIGLAIFITAAFATVSFANLKAKENRAMAIQRLIAFEAAEAGEIAQQVESIEAPITFEEPDTVEVRYLSLVLSSVEKDLKIKLVDDEDTLVKGIRWSVSVTNDKEETTDETDDDEDGIIHLTDVKSGDYSVSLKPDNIPEEYVLPTEQQVVSVKAKIEYKVIQDIKEEIKSEKEVNAAAEDVQGNQAADVETGPVNTDTVEWCESTKTPNGDSYVEATPDLTKTVSNKDGSRFLAVINNLKNSVRADFSKGVLATRLMLVAENEQVGVEGETQPETKPETSHEHTFGSATDNNNGTHSRKCTVEGCSETKTEDCTYSDSKCTECGHKKPGHSCTLTYKDNLDDDNHSTYCTEECDKGYPKSEAHVYDSDGKCTLCGHVKEKVKETVPEKTTHEHKFKYTSKNNGTHIRTCQADGCDGSFEEIESCSIEGGKCTKCGYVKSDDDDHVHKYKYTSRDNGKHDAVCDCGVTVKKEPCDYNSDGVCKYCGYKKESTSTAEYSDDAQLYDASKNALYVKEGDSYRLAKYSDYKSGSFSTYYRKAEAYLYTGWQTIDGKRYYYRSDNSFVTGDQIIGGVTYHFASDGVLSTNSGTLGIDVSKYQPNINWSSVKASGINYVIVRCGYRGSSTGVLIEDPYFKSHIKGAKSVGLKVGVYFFTTALTEAEAVEEASMCAYLCSSYGIDYPVFMDCEPSGRPGYNGMSASQRTEVIKAFCNTIKSAGYTPGVYANKTWLSEKMNVGALSGCRIWLAQYNSAGPTYSGRYDLWQYTSKGTVNGIKGYVDMNQSYLGY